MRETKKNIREENLVKFVRIKKTQEIDKIISMMKALNQHEDEAMRVCSVMEKAWIQERNGESILISIIILKSQYLIKLKCGAHCTLNEFVWH